MNELNVDPIKSEPVNPYLDRLFKEPEGEGAYKGRKREILIYPNAKLTEKSQEVKVFQPAQEWLTKLAADLVATAAAADGAGLSAIQVGEPVRVIVVRVGTGRFDWVVMVNPTVRKTEGIDLKQLVDEGCLSFPGIKEKVFRYMSVDVSYQDLEGKDQTMALSVVDPSTGAAAQAVQHEVEHLEGILLLNNLNMVHRDSLRMHMKQVNRKMEQIRKKSGGQLSPMAVLFGYLPDKDLEDGKRPPDWVLTRPPLEENCSEPGCILRTHNEGTGHVHASKVLGADVFVDGKKLDAPAEVKVEM